MVEAELEVFLSRAVAPTRRIALGSLSLPSDGLPVEMAQVLLGGIAATFGRRLDTADRRELLRLASDVELGRRVPQPRLRHRFQVDRIGLQRSVHRVTADRAGRLHLDLDHHRGTAAQHALVAVYASRMLGDAGRVAVIESVRRGLRWRGPLGPALIDHLRTGRLGGRLAAGSGAGRLDPTAWAMEVLGLRQAAGSPTNGQVRAAFREAVRATHPDLGGLSDLAAERLADIDSARRVLLG